VPSTQSAVTGSRQPVEKALPACLACWASAPHYRCRLGDHLASVIQTMACNPVWCTEDQTRPHRLREGLEPSAEHRSTPYQLFLAPSSFYSPLLLTVNREKKQQRCSLLLSKSAFCLAACCLQPLIASPDTVLIVLPLDR
jgi:hypothetical protein